MLFQMIDTQQGAKSTAKRIVQKPSQTFDLSSSTAPERREHGRDTGGRSRTGGPSPAHAWQSQSGPPLSDLRSPASFPNLMNMKQSLPSVNLTLPARGGARQPRPSIDSAPIRVSQKGQPLQMKDYFNNPKSSSRPRIKLDDPKSPSRPRINVDDPKSSSMPRINLDDPNSPRIDLDDPKPPSRPRINLNTPIESQPLPPCSRLSEDSRYTTSPLLINKELPETPRVRGHARARTDPPSHAAAVANLGMGNRGAPSRSSTSAYQPSAIQAYREIGSNPEPALKRECELPSELQLPKKHNDIARLQVPSPSLPLVPSGLWEVALKRWHEEKCNSPTSARSVSSDSSDLESESLLTSVGHLESMYDLSSAPPSNMSSYPHPHPHSSRAAPAPKSRANTAPEAQTFAGTTHSTGRERLLESALVKQTTKTSSSRDAPETICTTLRARAQQDSRSRAWTMDMTPPVGQCPPPSFQSRGASSNSTAREAGSAYTTMATLSMREAIERKPLKVLPDHARRSLTADVVHELARQSAMFGQLEESLKDSAAPPVPDVNGRGSDE